MAVFAFDSGDAAQVRRIAAIADGPFDPLVFSFHRNASDRAPDTFRNVDLGQSHHGQLGHRLRAALRAVPLVLRHRAALRQCRVIVARNLDMLTIAALCRFMAGMRGVPLVYECLDIHPLLTRPGLAGRLLRRLERALLDRCALLAVSSDAYVRHYFKPVQGHAGETVLWENRFQPGASALRRPASPAGPAEGPLRIAFVGSIRCGRSLDILEAAAARMDGGLIVDVHGAVNRQALPDFDARIARSQWLRWHGRYAYPDDLPGIYAGADFAWNLDFYAPGANSAWALSNRIYEASWCGCPSIAQAGTEMGRRVAQDGLGWVLRTADDAALVALLRSLDRPTIRGRAAEILAMPATAFETDGTEVRESLAALPGVGDADPARG